MSFSQEIIRWYSINKRPLPWRETKDPYKIWLSEIILQQTRVVQGTPYYLKFIDHFPTVFELAHAEEEKVLKLWQGLGYYSRARNLYATAKTVANDYKGVFPKDYKTLKTLKGVGDYTASAIASICYDTPEAVLDGNVFRVLARYLGVEQPINTPQGVKLFKQLALDYCDLKEPSNYNQGIMEFGALQCVSQRPNCASCPLQESCVAFQTNKVSLLPIKIPKAKPLKIHHHYLVPIDAYGNTVFEKREGKGIWEGLYEFPLVVAEDELDITVLLASAKGLSIETSPKAVPNYFLFNEKPIVHKLTHRHIYAHFWVLEIEFTAKNKISFSEIEKWPTAVLISDFINAFKNSYF